MGDELFAPQNSDRETPTSKPDRSTFALETPPSELETPTSDRETQNSKLDRSPS